LGETQEISRKEESKMNENRDLLEKTVVEIASLDASQIDELKELVKDRPSVSQTLVKVLKIVEIVKQHHK